MTKKSKAMKAATHSGHSPLSVWLASALAAVVALMLLMVAGSALICRVDLSHTVYPWLVTAFSALSCLVGGFTAALLTGENGFFRGCVLGAMLFLLVALVSVLQGRAALSIYAALKGLTFVSSGGIGGYLGVGFYKKKRRLRRQIG